MSGDVPGDGFHSTTRFTDRVADYVNGRPTYPLAVIDRLRKHCSFDADWSVVDVAAGTGLSTALFLGNGNATTAVEPNTAMREAADAAFAEDPNYDSVGTTAEATGLPDGCCDLVVAAQAFHWFDRTAFARECRRLLTPRGRVLILRNVLEPDAGPAAAAYHGVLKKHQVELGPVSGKWNEGDAAALEWFEPGTFVHETLANPQAFDAGRLAAVMASSSAMPGRGTPGFDAMQADLRTMFTEHASGVRLTLPYVTRLFLGVPESRGAAPPVEPA